MVHTVPGTSSTDVKLQDIRPGTLQHLQQQAESSHSTSRQLIVFHKVLISKISESEKHRIYWVRKDPHRSSSIPIPGPAQDTPGGTLCACKHFLNTSWTLLAWCCDHFPAELFQCPTTIQAKNLLQLKPPLAQIHVVLSPITAHKSEEISTCPLPSHHA